MELQSTLSTDRIGYSNSGWLVEPFEGLDWLVAFLNEARLVRARLWYGLDHCAEPLRAVRIVREDNCWGIADVASTMFDPETGRLCHVPLKEREFGEPL